MRRMFLSCIGLSLVAGTAGGATADSAPVAPGTAVVQSVGQPGALVANGGRRPMVRRYRSYSIDPGVGGAVTGGVPGVVESTPGPMRPAPAPVRPSKPSYMRGDAKARGQFHR